MAGNAAEPDVGSHDCESDLEASVAAVLETTGHGEHPESNDVEKASYLLRYDLDCMR